MTQFGLAFSVAATQKGNKEIPGVKHSPRIVEYHQACTLQATSDEIAWCSSFVNWSYLIAGIILNPAGMQQRLIDARFEVNDIAAFYKSAAVVAESLGHSSKPIFERGKTNYENVKLGTRSAAARSWLGFGEAVQIPQVGDLAIFSRGNNGWSGHVGWVTDIGVTFVHSLGGNQANKVSVAPYSRWRVLGYRREV